MAKGRNTKPLLQPGQLCDSSPPMTLAQTVSKQPCKPTSTLLQDLAAQVAAAVEFRDWGQQHTLTVSRSFRPQAVWRGLRLLDAGGTLTGAC